MSRSWREFISEIIRRHRDSMCEQCESSEFWDDYPTHMAEIIVEEVPAPKGWL